MGETLSNIKKRNQRRKKNPLIIMSARKSSRLAHMRDNLRDTEKLLKKTASLPVVKAPELEKKKAIPEKAPEVRKTRSSTVLSQQKAGIKNSSISNIKNNEVQLQYRS